EHSSKLREFLNSCGWKNNKIHNLVDLLNLSKEEYEKPPYCQSRAKSIVSVIKKYNMYIKNWATIDDLPLASDIPVCLPCINDINTLANDLKDCYVRYLPNIIQKEQFYVQHIYEVFWQYLQILPT